MFWRVSVTTSTISACLIPYVFEISIFKSGIITRTRTCAHQGVRNVSFSENFEYVLNEWPILIIISLLSFFFTHLLVSWWGYTHNQKSVFLLNHDNITSSMLICVATLCSDVPQYLEPLIYHHNLCCMFVRFNHLCSCLSLNRVFRELIWQCTQYDLLMPPFFCHLIWTLGSLALSILNFS